MEFEAEVRVGRRVLGRGSGTNRKRAEQQAAREGFEALTDSGG
jgi:dsRNA-specific ribonuclease